MKCSTCIHNLVCKHKDNYETIFKTVANYEIDIFKVAVDCRYYG